MHADESTIRRPSIIGVQLLKKENNHQRHKDLDPHLKPNPGFSPLHVNSTCISTP